MQSNLIWERRKGFTKIKCNVILSDYTAIYIAGLVGESTIQADHVNHKHGPSSGLN